MRNSHSSFIRVLLLCAMWYSTMQVAVAQLTPSDIDTTIKPIIPGAGALDDMPQSTVGMLPPLDSLKERMTNAYVFGNDSVPFKAKIIRYKKGHDQYQIWIYQSNMLIRHKYTKDCGKRSITKDCSWQEIDIPYSFVDSIRGVMFSPGYVIHYRNIQTRPAKFKLLVGKGEINYIAKVIKDEAKKRGVKLDSNFSFIYQDSWQTRVSVMLRILNRLGLKKITGGDLKKLAKAPKSPLEKITLSKRKEATNGKTTVPKPTASKSAKTKKEDVPKPTAGKPSKTKETNSKEDVPKPTKSKPDSTKEKKPVPTPSKSSPSTPKSDSGKKAVPKPK